ncbi:MAG TPA: peptidoglycan DD-metalloendopeptidase family protein [Negativicutes bacterium]
MSQIQRYLALSLIVLLVAIRIGPVLANELEQKQQELQNVQEQMEREQGKAASAQRQVDSVSEQLRRVQEEMDSALSEYEAIQKKLSYTEQQIQVNSEIMAKAEKSLAERSRILNKRMRDIYENGQVSYLDVLLGANDFGDLTTRADILKRIVNQDITLVAKVKAERALILQKKSELERDRAAIVELQAAAVAKKKQIEARKQEREGVLHNAVSERDTADQAYQELLETSRQIEQMVRRIQSGAAKNGPTGSTGAMLWPAEGPITSPFGWRTHPIFGTQLYHSGLDIGADYGDAVLAADGGVVIFADWMGGYGKAVIIDHGGGISTLYGHNSELLVSEGQRVRKGQTISRVGATGYATGPHLHFEVRVDGSPVNPMNYLP